MNSTLKEKIVTHFLWNNGNDSNIIPNTEHIVGEGGEFWMKIHYEANEEFGLIIDDLPIKDEILKNPMKSVIQFRKFILTEIGLESEIKNDHSFKWFFIKNNQKIIELTI